MSSEDSAQKKTSARGVTRVREGAVVSDKMDKTIIVATSRLTKHALYGKYVKRTQKYYAHDQENECRVGDVVRIIETRPFSKQKRWRVQKVLTKVE